MILYESRTVLNFEGMVTVLATVTDVPSLGRAVRSARKERGLSQRALAERCHCSQRFVSELERGKPTAELGKAFSVLVGLGLTVSIQSADAAAGGRAAVNQLVETASRQIGREARRSTSLRDYLGERA